MLDAIPISGMAQRHVPAGWAHGRGSADTKGEAEAAYAISIVLRTVSSITLITSGSDHQAEKCMAVLPERMSGSAVSTP